MATIELGDVPVTGALSQAWTETGVSFHRLPQRAMQQVIDPVMAFQYATPAGVRLRFSTDAEALELDVKLTLVQTRDTPLAAAFDLVVDGVVRDSVATTTGTVIVARPGADYEVIRGTQTTVRFDGISAPGDAHIEIWLPHTAAVELRGFRVIGGTGVAPIAPTAPRWIHYGSSISHCLEAPTPTRTWPALVARRLGLDMWNLAASGQCQLDQCVARAIRDLDADVISIKAGVNVLSTMRERTLVPALHGFLDTVRDGHPTTPIVVATPIIYPAAEECAGTSVVGDDDRYHVRAFPPEHAEGALTLSRVRQLVEEVVSGRRRAGDVGLHLVDGLTLFGAGDLDELPDGLHPSATGYERMAERFAPVLTTVTDDLCGEGPRSASELDDGGMSLAGANLAC